ncbi:MAG: hypothetical protein ACTSQY_08875 [Candidatus Odinarchaeia archaeon]
MRHLVSIIIAVLLISQLPVYFIWNDSGLFGGHKLDNENFIAYVQEVAIRSNLFIIRINYEWSNDITGKSIIQSAVVYYLPFYKYKTKKYEQKTNSSGYTIIYRKGCFS